VSGSGLVDVTSAELTLTPNTPGSYVFTYTDTAETAISWPFTITYSVPSVNWNSYVIVDAGTPQAITSASVINVHSTDTVSWQVVVTSGASSVQSVTVTCIATKGSCPFGAEAMSQTAAGTWTSPASSYPAGSYTISATINGPTIPSPGVTAFSVLLPTAEGLSLTAVQTYSLGFALIGVVLIAVDQRKKIAKGASP